MSPRAGGEQDPAASRWDALSTALTAFTDDDTCLGLTVVESGSDRAFSLSRTGPDGEMEMSFVLCGTQLDRDLPVLQRWFALQALPCTEDLITDDLLRGDFATRHVSWSLPAQTAQGLYRACYRLLTEALGVRAGADLEFSLITAPDVNRTDRPV